MASSILRVKTTIKKDLFDQNIFALKQAASDGIYNVMVGARDYVRPLTPRATRHRNGGPRLSEPTIYKYDNGTCSLQWRANNLGFYYGSIQNERGDFAHPNGGGPGFAEAAEAYIEKYTPQAISELYEAEG